MKKIISIITVFLALSINASAYSVVKFTIRDGIGDKSLKDKMERAVTRLLNEINRSQEENISDISLLSQYMLPEAVADITKLWANEHFRCEEDVVEDVLHTLDGYQVRNIPLIVNASKGKEELGYQEAVINFDKNGAIVSFHYAANPDIYSKQIRDVLQNRRYEVSELQQRMKILDYVEHFRTAYNQKDLKFIRQVFSDDALIITGRVITTRKTEIHPSGYKLEYAKQTKTQYLKNLEKVFRSSRSVRVKFDDVIIVKHPSIKGIYGVTVRQKWTTDRYSDDGYVFMLWDFRNEYQPQIHVRTWQPEFLDKSKSQRLKQEDIFSISDFDL